MGNLSTSTLPSLATNSSPERSTLSSLTSSRASFVLLAVCHSSTQPPISAWSLYRPHSAGAAESGFNPPSQAAASVAPLIDASSPPSRQTTSPCLSVSSKASIPPYLSRVSFPHPKTSFLEAVPINPTLSTSLALLAILSQKIFPRSPKPSYRNSKGTNHA